MSLTTPIVSDNCVKSPKVGITTCSSLLSTVSSIKINGESPSKVKINLSPSSLSTFSCDFK